MYQEIFCKERLILGPGSQQVWRVGQAGGRHSAQEWEFSCNSSRPHIQPACYCSIPGVFIWGICRNSSTKSTNQLHHTNSTNSCFENDLICRLVNITTCQSTKNASLRLLPAALLSDFRCRAKK
ncbi:hypothetical protein N1851_027155 [Merluccius polli]|uniref:Uncharacterized protein n=1 Tax=Merluccius polli TaxID=89951 RepID=A0AA47MAT1_MERPO|nr:hypothetical protein N1851_027155 [Merluccius polli]